MSIELPMKMNQLVVDACLARNEMKQRQSDENTASHEALWALVHLEYPELDFDNTTMTLKAEFAEQGVVMLVESEECECDAMPEELQRMLAALKSSPGVTEVTATQVKGIN